MPDVLIDVRCRQDPDRAGTAARRTALALLREARRQLPGRKLVGLADRRWAVPEEVRALLDWVRTTAYSGAMQRPTCFVQLTAESDPLAVARLLLHPDVPSVSVADREDDREGIWPRRVLALVRQHWAGRADVSVRADREFWTSVRSLAPLRAPAVVRGTRATLALIAPAPDPSLCAALQEVVNLEVFEAGPGWPLSAFPLLSPRFDRVISVLGNTARHAPVLGGVSRFGGAVVAQDPCLLSAYGQRDGSVQALAAAELGRAVRTEEVARWHNGEIRVPATLLGDVAASAEPLMVHSPALRARLAGLCPRPALLIPRAITPGNVLNRPGEGRIAALASGSAAEACVWALDMLRAWRVCPRLHVVGAPGAELSALCGELGLTAEVGFGRDLGACDIAVFLAMRGQGSLPLPVLQLIARGVPCVVSEWVAEALELPAWVCTVPDEPSPPLIAEALAAALAARPTGEAVQAFQRRHDPARCARLLCEALGLTG
ncbi:MAG: hypothetical protein JOZ05_14390 [Acetobacteraceae bacterium]|nr:hypothetical protein [Acetobacteraceae bacterium]